MCWEFTSTSSKGSVRESNPQLFDNKACSVTTAPSCYLCIDLLSLYVIKFKKKYLQESKTVMSYCEDDQLVKIENYKMTLYINPPMLLFCELLACSVVWLGCQNQRSTDYHGADSALNTKASPLHCIMIKRLRNFDSIIPASQNKYYCTCVEGLWNSWEFHSWKLFLLLHCVNQLLMAKSQ